MKKILVVLSMILVSITMSACSGEDPVSPTPPIIPTLPPIEGYDSTGNAQSFFLGTNETLQIDAEIPHDSNLTIMVWIKINIPEEYVDKNSSRYVFDYSCWSEVKKQWFVLSSLQRRWPDTTLQYRTSPFNSYRIPQPNGWHHYAIVRSSRDKYARMYFDGVVIDEKVEFNTSEPQGEQLTRSKKRLFFGMHTNAPENYYLYTGSFCQYSNFLLYDVPFSESEIQASMRTKPLLSDPSTRKPVVYIDFNGSVKEYMKNLTVNRRNGKFIADVPF